MTLLDLITNAALEIGSHSPGEALSNDDAQFGLKKANDILDEWAAREAYAYNMTFTAYTLTPGHGPHLIGPNLVAPDFAAAQRPIKIAGAAIILNTSTPAIDVPLNIRDDDWWNGQRVKTLESNIPKDLYYSPDWPNGSLNLWPVPNIAYGLRLESWVLLAQFATLNDSVSLPPAYRNALTLTLAEAIAPGFGAPVTAGLMQRAMKARAAVQSNNLKSPRISTRDAGMPRSGGDRTTNFNWRTGPF